MILKTFCNLCLKYIICLLWSLKVTEELNLQPSSRTLYQIVLNPEEVNISMSLGVGFCRKELNGGSCR